MKKHKNSQATTVKGLPSQSEIERASESANPQQKFEVTLFWTQHSIGKVIIEAGSLAEAEEMAQEIEAYEVEDFNPTAGDLFVDSVEPVEEGQDNE